LLLFGSTLHAQWQNGLWTEKQAYNWYFNDEAGINFDTSPPSILTGGMITSIDKEGVGTISDAEGNLLFYTNGVTVWNKDHEIMENGEGLLGNGSTTQSGLIVPAPGDPGIYYIFHQDDDGNAGGLYYSEVNMELAAGLGAVTENKNVELTEITGEKLTAVHHADGEQVWVLCHKGGRDENHNPLPSNEFLAFLVSAEGVSITPIISAVGEELSLSYGQMKLSPNGKKIAFVNKIPYPGFSGAAHVLDFDSSTGVVSNPINLTSGVSSIVTYGVEFSPNSRFLYTTDVGAGVSLAAVHQFDLEAGDEDAILDSNVIISQPLETTAFWGLQVAPDGKIYLAQWWSSSGMQAIGVINYPNNIGDAVDVELGAIATTVRRSFPSFLQSYFASGIIFEGGPCAGEGITFSTLRIPGITDIVWNFGDPDSASNNTSTDLEPSHIFSAPGTYIVTAIITSNGAEQTATTEVVVTAPEANVPVTTNTTLCADGSGNTVFNLTDLTSEILNGQDPTIFTVSYYASEMDLIAEIPIAEPATFSTTGQIIYAKVISSETGCSTMIEFTLVVNPLPQAIIPIVAPQCADTDGTAVFDLTQQEEVIVGNQNPSDFTVTFYATEAEIEAGTPITTPENFATAGQTVYAVVTNNTTGCVASVAIELPVTPLPVADAPDDIVACDSYELPALSGSNAYWTGTGGTGEPLSAGQIITEDVTVYVLATSPNNPDCTVENVFNIIISTVDITFEAGCEGTAYWLQALPADTSFNPDTVEYLWSGPEFSSSEPGFAVPAVGIYTVVITTEEGCIGEESFEVESTTCVVPKGISPNGDGMNDNFDLLSYDVRKLRIFNRYGQEVYSRANYTNEWYGQSDRGNELPSGTYYYMIERENGESKTGWVYINRQE